MAKEKTKKNASILPEHGPIDENGRESKPFMLPQKHPLHYYSYQNRSYNVPEFVTGPVDMDRINAEKLINSDERIPFGFRMSE